MTSKINPHDFPAIGLAKTAARIDGLQFGKLTALRPAGRQGNNILWLSSCECGGHKLVAAAQLKAGRVTSCGCKAGRKVVRKRKSEPKKQLPSAELVSDLALYCIEVEEGVALTSKQIAKLELDVRIKRSTQNREKHQSEAKAKHERRMANDLEYARKYRERKQARIRKADERARKDAKERSDNKLVAELRAELKSVEARGAYAKDRDTAEKTVGDWLNDSNQYDRYTIPELRELDDAVSTLRADGPGAEEYEKVYFDWVLDPACNPPMPTPPAWLTAINDMSKRELTIPGHILWIEEFDYYYYEENAA